MYHELNTSFHQRFSHSVDYFTANVYDACWITALSTIEADRRNATVTDVLPEVAAGYTGATGLCLLDMYGDREAADYAYLCYASVDGEPRCIRCGWYSYASGEIEWNLPQ